MPTNDHSKLTTELPELFCTFSDDGRVLEASLDLLELLGLVVGEVQNRTLGDLVLTDDRGRLSDSFHLVVSGAQQVATCLVRMLHVSGSVRNLHWVFCRGEDRSINGAATDLTRFLEGEARAAKERELADAVLRSVADIAVVFDRDGHILQWSRTCETLTGFTFAEVAGRPVWETMAVPEDVNALKLRFSDIDALTPCFPLKSERFWRKKSGGSLRFALQYFASFDPAGRIAYLLGIGTEMTWDRKGANLLEQAERRYAAILTAHPDLVFIIDKNCVIREYYANSGMPVYVKPKDFLDRRVADVLPRRVAEQTKSAVERALASETHVVVSYEYSLMMGDEERFYEARVTKFSESSCLSLVRDVTEQHVMRQRLEESIRIANEQKFALNQTAIVTITDTAGRILEVNDKFCEISGFSREELVGKTHRLVNSGYHPKVFWAEMWRTITQGTLWRGEVCNRTKNGELYWVDATIIPLLDEYRKPRQYFAIRIDITERKRAQSTVDAQQSQIAAASKMSALGEMAGAIAHEINNPLAVISAKASQLRNMIENGKAEPDFLKNNLAKIESTALRIAKIIKGLRTISRDGEQDPFLPVSVKTLVEDTLELCRERFRNHDIDLQVAPLPETLIECRAVQISQILLNLLNNAYDAVNTYETKWVRIEAVNFADHVEMSVTDSGGGIPESVATRIMEPFFTTKSVGKGSGLGLSISLGIAQEHHGDLRLNRDAPNTQFILSLPLMQKSGSCGVSS